MKCQNCKDWDALERPCTLASHGECDCPKCQGTCDCTHDFFCVSVYLVNKAWGGPEEGGWWYTYGIPAAEYGWKTKCFGDWDDAHAYVNELNEWIDEAHINDGRRDIGSVLSEGQYQAHMDEGTYPAPWPAKRPHYE
jgi:hypothetical protein